LSVESVGTFRAFVANSYQIRRIVIPILEIHIQDKTTQVWHQGVEVRYHLSYLLSLSQNLELVRLDVNQVCGTPVEAQRSTDDLICRSVRATGTAVELTTEEPPELNIGEAPLSVPAHGIAEYDCEDKLCVWMPGRPSPVSISGHDLSMTTNPGAMSPSSSPRLPSPPPFTEVQIGPKSPTTGASATGSELELGGINKPDTGATRRIRPGTKAADMASGPPLVPLSEVSYTSQAIQSSLQRFCKLLYNSPCTKSKTSSTPLSNSKNISKRSTTRTPNPPAPHTKSQ
jgi:hypothetical protein